MKSIFYGGLLASLMTSTAYAVEVEGYLYTTLNGETTNQVISFERNDDGTIGAQIAYPTGDLGGANRAAGGDAAGDFDAQGAVQIIGNYLLAVNAGGNSVSVFAIDRSNGELAHVGNTASGGTRPVSIAFVPKAPGSENHWVVVGNQWNNPNVQKGGDGEGAIEHYPDAAFHADNGGHGAVLDDRNIQLFSFNAATGALTAERTLDTYPGTNGGPTTVSFNAAGSKIAVSTWGISHFGTATPTEQKPSRVYVYDFDAGTGDIANERFFEEDGVAGSIGFSWDHETDHLYVSNFNLTVDKRDHSLTVLVDDGQSVTLNANLGTGNGDDIDEACWTLVSPDGSKLYVSSFGGNLISEFDIDNGFVTKVGDEVNTTYALRKDGTPPGDSKDMYITEDGDFMYVLGAYQTFSLASFDISDSGALSLSHEYKVDAATETGPGAYNFLGLVGFDK